MGFLETACFCFDFACVRFLFPLILPFSFALPASQRQFFSKREERRKCSVLLRLLFGALLSPVGVLFSPAECYSVSLPQWWIFVSDDVFFRPAQSG